MRERLTKQMETIIDRTGPLLSGAAAMQLADDLESMIQTAEDIAADPNTRMPPPAPTMTVEVAAVATIATMIDTALAPIRACLDDLVAVGIAGVKR